MSDREDFGEGHDYQAWIDGTSLIIPLGIAPFRSLGAHRQDRPKSTVNGLIFCTTFLVSVALLLVAAFGAPQVALSLGLWANERYFPTQLVTYVFVHGSLAHLVGNMVFLIAFGQASASLLRWAYLPTYLAFGAFSAAAGFLWVGPQQMGLPLVGASGAISGVCGFYLVLFTRDRVRMAVWFRPWGILAGPLHRRFTVPAIYVVLGFAVYDTIMLATGAGGPIAHDVHLAGLGAGAALGLLLLVTGIVHTHGYDLLSWVFGRTWRGLLRSRNAK